MSGKLFPLTALFLALSYAALGVGGQTYFCKRNALSALRTIPKLNYKCREEIPDYADELLTFPERVAAIGKYAKSLEKFNEPAWWGASVDDLTFCDVRRKPGPLSKKEKADLNGGEYLYRLFGNRQIRVVMTADPCYQTGFGGSDIFLLYRLNGRTKVTEIVDGFSSRADNPIFVNFADLNGEQIVEIASSTGGFYPMVINYYFSIDKRTGKANPKKLFKTEKGLTNVITSMMLLADPEEYGLPPKSEPLVIMKNGHLTRRFSVFDDTGSSANGNQGKFTETVMRWNGKFYE